MQDWDSEDECEFGSEPVCLGLDEDEVPETIPVPRRAFDFNFLGH